MFRFTTLHASACCRTRALLGGGINRHRGGSLPSKFTRPAPLEVINKVGIVMETPPPEVKAKVPESKAPPVRPQAQKMLEENSAASHVKTHTPPSKVLTRLLEEMIVKQKTFLFGAETSKKGDHPEGNFFQVIDDSYKQRMKDAFQREVDDYKKKREMHYAKRLSEETEEYRRERRAIHDELYRTEGDRYRNSLTDDIRTFTTSRQKEYEARLRDDIQLYNGALLSYGSGKGEGQDTELDLTMNTPQVADAMKKENAIFDFGSDDQENGADLTDDDIRNYVTERFHFYEKYLQEEMKRFTARRKGFYEDLLQASAIRHAAKVRTDTVAFHQKRERYYEAQIIQDVIWMERSLENHYNVCFLQLYAREAWLSRRSEYIKGNTKTEDDLSSINITQLEKLVPLSTILSIYERESIGDISREAFVSAGRRMLKIGAGGAVNDDVDDDDDDSKLDKDGDKDEDNESSGDDEVDDSDDDDDDDTDDWEEEEEKP